MSSPAKVSRPGQPGTKGAPLYPVATTTARAQRAVVGLEAPQSVLRLEPGHAHAGAHLELVPLRVVVEVGEEVVAGDPAAVLPRDPEAGEAREKARRVQPQPVVALPPRGAGLGARLEDDRLEPLLPEEGCGRETG